MTLKALLKKTRFTYILANAIRSAPYPIYAGWMRLCHAVRGVEKNTVYFSSFNGALCDDNPRAIAEALHEICPSAKLVFRVNKEGLRQEVPDYITRVYGFSPRGVAAMATARVIVKNANVLPWMRVFPDQKYVQTWHGDRGFKRIALDLWPDRKDLNLFAQAWRLLGPRYGLDYNPWTDERIARLKLQPQHRRNLTRAECKAVMAAATLEERAMIEIALRTALRLGDVVRLKWRDIDMERLWLTRVNRKTGRTTAVPIVKPLAETLDAWRRESGGPDGPDDWVFPAMVARIRPDGDTENVSEIFSRLFRRAGIQTSEKLANGRMTPRATFHSLRHTFITNLIEAGVDPLLVRDAAGHSVMATTAGYTHIGEKTLRRAIARSAK